MSLPSSFQSSGKDRKQGRSQMGLFVRRTLERLTKRDRSEDTWGRSWPVSGPGHTHTLAAFSRDWETTGLGVWSGSGCPGLGVTPSPWPPYSQVHRAGGREDRAVPGPEPSPHVQRLVHGHPGQHEEGEQLPRVPSPPRLRSLSAAARRPWSHIPMQTPVRGPRPPPRSPPSLPRPWQL